jgi:hypothetical protein
MKKDRPTLTIPAAHAAPLAPCIEAARRHVDPSLTTESSCHTAGDILIEATMR